MKHIIYSIATVGLLLLTACGLKYTPPVSKANLAADRQKLASNYIRNSYKDSAVTYQSITFGQPTTLKPYIYEQLDSLYEIKYRNEQAGRFDKSLEEKIANQKIVIQASSQRVQYAEHHVYAIQAPSNSHVYYADIIFDEKNEVVQYIATLDYEIPTNQLSLFRSYVIGESFIQGGYEQTNGERDLIEVMNKELDRKVGEDANEYMRQLLNVLFIVKMTKQVETKNILKNIVLMNTENRMFNNSTDKVIRADALVKDNKTIGYEIEVETPTGKKVVAYTNGFDILE